MDKETEHQAVLFYQFDQQNAHTGAAWALDPGTLGPYLAINLTNKVFAFSITSKF